MKISGGFPSHGHPLNCQAGPWTNTATTRSLHNRQNNTYHLLCCNYLCWLVNRSYTRRCLHFVDSILNGRIQYYHWNWHFNWYYHLASNLTPRCHQPRSGLQSYFEILWDVFVLLSCRERAGDKFGTPCWKVRYGLLSTFGGIAGWTALPITAYLIILLI